MNSSHGVRRNRIVGGDDDNDDSQSHSKKKQGRLKRHATKKTSRSVFRAWERESNKMNHFNQHAATSGGSQATVQGGKLCV